MMLTMTPTTPADQCKKQGRREVLVMQEEGQHINN
jgi:hypothetical protein